MSIDTSQNLDGLQTQSFAPAETNAASPDRIPALALIDYFTPSNS